MTTMTKLFILQKVHSHYRKSKLYSMNHVPLKFSMGNMPIISNTQASVASSIITYKFDGGFNGQDDLNVGPEPSLNSSGETSIISLHASSSSFCILALRFLKNYSHASRTVI